MVIVKPERVQVVSSVQVKVTILEEDERLKPEMTSRVTFLEKEPEAEVAESGEVPPIVTVPRQAVTVRDGRSVVFEVLDGRVRMRPVLTAGERDGRVVVKEGLSGGEILVGVPSSELADGDAVRIEGS